MNYNITKYSVVLLFCFYFIPKFTSAQSARIEALGWNFCIDDFSFLSGNPALEIDYTDAIQATAYQDGTFGPVIGIKSIGNIFSIGFSANTADDIYSNFYDNATLTTDSLTDTLYSLPGKFPSFPHLFLTAHLPFGAVGIEVFYKRSHLSSKYTEGLSGFRVEKSIKKAGITVSSALKAGMLGIYPSILLAKPDLRCTSEVIGADSSVIVSTNSNRTLKASLELGLSSDYYTISLGGALFNETYSFENSIYKSLSRTNYYSTALDLYTGFSVYPNDNLLLSALYSFNYGIYENISEHNNVITQNTSDTWVEKNHLIATSCELSRRLTSRLIYLFFRAGLLWSLNTSEWNSDSNYGLSVSSEKINYPANVSQIIPTAGIGIKKEIVQFDIALKLAELAKSTGGMQIITCTLTLDFSNVNALKNRKKEP